MLVVEQIKDLGVVFDSKLKFDEHIHVKINKLKFVKLTIKLLVNNMDSDVVLYAILQAPLAASCIA